MSAEQRLAARRRATTADGARKPLRFWLEDRCFERTPSGPTPRTGWFEDVTDRPDEPDPYHTRPADWTPPPDWDEEKDDLEAGDARPF
ncbi:MAG: hypothetical protein AAGE90_18995 [Pseudomonadota bacterium]